MASKMECLNLAPFCYEDRARDAPKTRQDTLGCLKTSPETPKTLQYAPNTGPIAV